MDDRQLLEAAANAAEIELADSPFLHTRKQAGALTAEGRIWNPLTDDGDALRLAVQCGLKVSFVNEDGEDRACVGYSSYDHISDHIAYVFEDHRGDIFAATRRAIVRAAASMAKGVSSPAREGTGG